jgi:diguanylate cyclase (GGDEF)-like protein
MAGADILLFPQSNNHPPPVALTDVETGLTELRIANRLHRHLDIQSLLEHFLLEMRERLPIEGLHLKLPDTGEQFIVGRGASRAVRSRIDFAGELIGLIELQLNAELDAPIASILAPLTPALFNALTHHRLKLLARKDPLTGLGNRMALDCALATELARAQRFGLPFSLLVVDIDHFKRINDSSGHSTGDRVIRSVATRIRDCLRPYDQAFRFGGEEFVVILSQTGLAKGLQIAERIRQEIEQHARRDTGHAGTVTASIGAAEMGRCDNVDELFARADRALYRAKGEGRNRVIAAD